ncbi:MAG TPA: ATP-binding protein [Candidatus Sulfotelmatobacter sp.]|nr:ATP-binding protein [Candidatus Sulfotelmatobacter sp.]
MIKRELEAKLKKAARQYPVVGIIGPRQSGKTTLSKAVFGSYPYVSLEKPSELEFAIGDPEGFLAQFPKNVIIDEVQRAPKLFSYIQIIVDQAQKPGMFVLTGSQNFELLAKISQSLAGRAALQTLLPFSFGELERGGLLPARLPDLLFRGGYPRIYDKKLNATDWLSNYVTAYLERDVRSIKNVGDLSTFQRFLKMCAFRSGKILNLSSLANDCGITHNTAKAWLSILEASYIIFLLSPYYNNFNKRLIKAPKLYFCDTGLLCYLLGLRRAEDVKHHPEIGSIFETFVVGEIAKMFAGQGRAPALYFWRDKMGREIDCLIETGRKAIPLEIKAGQTISNDFFTNLNYWNSLSKSKPAEALVVYGGDASQKRSNGRVLSWRDLSEVEKLILT